MGTGAGPGPGAHVAIGGRAWILLMCAAIHGRDHTITAASGTLPRPGTFLFCSFLKDVFIRGGA